MNNDWLLGLGRWILKRLTAIIRIISQQIRQSEPKVLLLGQDNDKNLLDSIVKHLQEAGLSAERPFTLDPNEQERVLEEKLERAAREVWILVLADPQTDGNISRAINKFAGTRQDVPILVTGAAQRPAETLAGYTYFKIQGTNGHGLIGKIIQAIASRISHFQRLLLYGLFMGLVAAILFGIFGARIGYWAAQNLARQGMESVENFDSAIFQTSPGQKVNLVRSANGKDTGDSLTQFQARGRNFRLTDVAFIDALIHVEPELFALCLEKNDGYIKKRRPRFLGREGKESSTSDAPEIWKFIEDEAPKLLFPSKGSRKGAVVLAALLTKDQISSDLNIEGWGKAFNRNNGQTILILAEGAKVSLKNQHLFSINKLSRAPTSRICAVTKDQHAKDSLRLVQQIKQLIGILR